MPVDRLITNNEVEDILKSLVIVLQTGNLTSGSYQEKFEMLYLYIYRKGTWLQLVAELMHLW